MAHHRVTDRAAKCDKLLMGVRAGLAQVVCIQYMCETLRQGDRVNERKGSLSKGESEITLRVHVSEFL